MKKSLICILTVLILGLSGASVLAHEDYYRCRYDHGYGPTYYSGGYIGYTYGYGYRDTNREWRHPNRHYKHHGRGYYDHHYWH